MCLYFRIVILSLFCFFQSPEIVAQGQGKALTKLLNQLDSIENRPKIGLALSGGAAHGLAHIGVIKYLEEQGIQFDYITGTSMGSIIGGLLSMGYNAKQLTKIASSQNWPLILSNYVPLNEISPAEKFMHNKIPLQLTYDDKTLSLPKGVLAGQKLDMLISRLYSPAFEISDFDQLPIPFRCFAVDIVTGNIETLKNGYLGKAIRSSMAIPTVFTPVEDGEKLLVDGGLIRNFPVEDNYSMGADLVIGVYVGSKLEEKDKLRSLFDIMKQSASLLSIKDSEEQKQLCSVFIEPPVKDFDGFNFLDYQKIIKKGYEEAQKYEVEISAIAEKLKQFNEENKVIEVLKFPDPLVVNEVKVSYARHPFDDLLLSKLNIKNGDFVSTDRLEKDIANIYGTKNFGNIAYSILNKEGINVLDIYAPPKESIDLGINVNYFYSSNTSILINAQIRNKIFKPTRLNLTARLSQFPGGNVDFIYRLGRSQSNAIGLEGQFEKYKIPLILDNKLLGEYLQFDSKAKLKWIWEPDNSLQFGLNFGIQKNEIRRSIRRVDDFISYQQLQSRIGLDINLNELNNRYFSNKGWLVEFKSGYNFSRKLDFDINENENIITDDGINQFIDLSLFVLKAFQVSPKFISHSSLKSIYHSKSLPLQYNGFGGMNNSKLGHTAFIGAHELQYKLYRAFYVRQSIYYDLGKYIWIGVSANYVNGIDILSSFLQNEELADKRVSVFGYGLSLGLKSPIGPLFFDIGVADQHLETSIGIGHRYFF